MSTSARTILIFPLLILSVLAFYMNADARIITQTVEYKDGDIKLEGYLAYDDSLKSKAPGVIVVHEWTGLGPYVKSRAEQLARLGYVAFCVDMYGKGVRPKNADEAAVQAGIYRADRSLMRRRVAAGLEQLKNYPLVDEKRLAAIGYCFGGGVVLELARSGAPIAGVVSFHGNLDTPHPEDAKNIKAKILVCHGANDPVVTAEQVTAFQNEMRSAAVDWEMNIYGNALHGFTNPDSGNDTTKAVAYNKEADTRSWQAMRDFFNEIFSFGH